MFVWRWELDAAYIPLFSLLFDLTRFIVETWYLYLYLYLYLYTWSLSISSSLYD